MPASTRATMTAVRKNGSANASVKAWPSRLASTDLADEIADMRQVAAGRGRVAGWGSGDHASSSFASQEESRVVGEPGLLQEDRNVPFLHDVDDLGEVLSGRRDSRDRLRLCSDLEAESIRKIGPGAVVGDHHLHGHPVRHRLSTLPRLFRFLPELIGTAPIILGMLWIDRGQRLGDRLGDDGPVPWIRPVVGVAVRVYVTHRGVDLLRRLFEKGHVLGAIDDPNMSI